VLHRLYRERLCFQKYINLTFYVMDNHWVKIIFWLAFVCYTIPIYNYLLWLYEETKLDGVNYIQYARQIIVIIAFSLLSYNSLIHAIEIQKEDTVSFDNLHDINYVTSTPANIGYFLMAIYTFTYVFPARDYSSPDIFLWLSIIGYLCLASRNNIGLYLIFISYLQVLVYHSWSSTDRFGILSKFGLVLYFGTYMSRHIMLSIKKKNFQMYSTYTYKKSKDD